ncbi:MAG: hypothetical protein VX185_14675 [Pseudomonadota bacterium]|nr:hypothetical protein [Pseudomonadota bacterium]
MVVNANFKSSLVLAGSSLYGFVSKGFESAINIIPEVPKPRFFFKHETHQDDAVSLHGINENQSLTVTSNLFSSKGCYLEANNIPQSNVEKIKKYFHIKLSRDNNLGWMRAFWVSTLSQKSSQEITEILERQLPKNNEFNTHIAAIELVSKDFNSHDGKKNLNLVLDEDQKLRNEEAFVKVTEALLNNIASHKKNVVSKSETKETQGLKFDPNVISNKGVLNKEGLFELMSEMKCNMSLMHHQYNSEEKVFELDSNIKMLQQPLNKNLNGNGAKFRALNNMINQNIATCDEFEHYSLRVPHQSIVEPNNTQLELLSSERSNAVQLTNQVASNLLSVRDFDQTLMAQGEQLLNSTVDPEEQTLIQLSGDDNHSWMRASWLSIASQIPITELARTLENTLEIIKLENKIVESDSNDKKLPVLNFEYESAKSIRNAFHIVKNLIEQSCNQYGVVDLAKLLDTSGQKAKLKHEHEFSVLTLALLRKSLPDLKGIPSHKIDDVMSMESKSGGLDFMKNLHRKMNCKLVTSKKDGSDKKNIITATGVWGNDLNVVMNQCRIPWITNDVGTQYNIRVSNAVISVPDSKANDVIAPQYISMQEKRYLEKPKVYFIASNYNNKNKDVASVYLAVVQQGKVLKAARVMGQEKNEDLSYLELPERINQLFINHHKDHGRGFANEYELISTKKQEEKLNSSQEDLTTPKDENPLRSSIMKLNDREIESDLDESFYAVEMTFNDVDLKYVLRQLDNDSNNSIPLNKIDEDDPKLPESKSMTRKEMKKFVRLATSKSNQKSIYFDFRKQFNALYLKGDIGGLTGEKISSHIKSLKNADSAQVLFDVLSFSYLYQSKNSGFISDLSNDEFEEAIKSNKNLNAILEGLVVAGRKSFIEYKNDYPSVSSERLQSIENGMVNGYKDQFLKEIRKIMTSLDNENSEMGMPSLMNFQEFKGKTINEGEKNYVLEDLYSSSNASSRLIDSESILFPHAKQNLFIRQDQVGIDAHNIDFAKRKIKGLVESLKHYYTTTLLNMNADAGLEVYTLLNEALNTDKSNTLKTGTSMVFSGLAGLFTASEYNFTYRHEEAARSMAIATGDDIVIDASNNDKQFNRPLHKYELDSYKKLRHIEGTAFSNAADFLKELPVLQTLELISSAIGRQFEIRSNNVIQDLIKDQLSRLSPELYFDGDKYSGLVESLSNEFARLNNSLRNINISYDFSEQERVLNDFSSKLSNYLDSLQDKINSITDKSRVVLSLNTLASNLYKPEFSKFDSAVKGAMVRMHFADFLLNHFDSLSSGQKKSLKVIIGYIFRLKDRDDQIVLPETLLQNKREVTNIVANNPNQHEQMQVSFDGLFEKLSFINQQGYFADTDAGKRQLHREYSKNSELITEVDESQYHTVDFKASPSSNESLSAYLNMHLQPLNNPEILQNTNGSNIMANAYQARLYMNF